MQHAGPRIVVRADRPAPPHAPEGSVWPLRNVWNRATENLYSAWIESCSMRRSTPSFLARCMILRDHAISC
jgi:hypothetical protein